MTNTDPVWEFNGLVIDIVCFSGWRLNTAADRAHQRLPQLPARLACARAFIIGWALANRYRNRHRLQNAVATKGRNMLTIHHLGKSQSERIIWLCEELGLAYQLKFYERDAVTMLSPPELKALHPLGAAPVITDTEHDKPAAADGGAWL